MNEKCNELRTENLGKVVISVNGLRLMARNLKKRYKTEGNVEVKCYLTKWREKGEIKKTLGIEVK